MDRTALARILQSDAVDAGDLLKQAQFDDLDELLALLKDCRPLDEVRSAFLERVAIAPLGEFIVLKVMYFRHFDAREH